MNRKQLESKSKKELIELILRLESGKYLNLNEDIKDVKREINAQYYPKGKDIGDANQKLIKKLIENYKHLTLDENGFIELCVYNTEKGIKYTNDYGDIDEDFYDGVIEIYEDGLKLIKKHNLIDVYNSKCNSFIKKTDGIGWV